MGNILKPGESIKIPVLIRAADNGAHGAITMRAATLIRSDGSTADLTPVDKILREQGNPVNPAVEAEVDGTPAYNAGGGTGGKNVHTITTAATHTFVSGDFVRRKVGATRGIYKVDTVTGTTLKVFAANNELDVADNDTLEKVLPEGWYRAEAPCSYANLNGLHGSVELEIDGVITRGNDPVLTVLINERKPVDVGPFVDDGAIKIA